MKHVQFNRISIINFLSIGTEPVIIDFTPGIHIITGINKDRVDRRNGVGKSTIADAIHFAIFGSTIRELKRENVVNNIICKDCKVELEFSVTKNDKCTNYRVVRTLEPSKCFLYVNGQDKTRDSIIRTTEYICKVINASSDIFQNCVLLTLNNTIPFMGKKKVEKRKFIEGIFNLEVFSCMLSVLRNQYNDVKREFDVQSGKQEEIENVYADSQEDKLKYREVVKKKKSKYLGRKSSNIREVEKLQDRIFETDGKELGSISQSMQEIQDNIDACESKITGTSKDISCKETEIKFKTETLDKIGTENDQCPVCLKPVSDHDREELQRERSIIITDIENVTAAMNGKKLSLTEIGLLKKRLKLGLNNQTTLYNDHILRIKDNQNDKKRLNQLNVWLDQLDQDLDNLRQENTEYDEIIKKHKSRLVDIKTTVEGIKSKLQILDVVKFVVSEEGVKSYIVKKILQVFNSKIFYYLRKMDGNCCCIFNEYFEEEIVDEKNKICSYYNFSGAERKNIDLACLFAFMDIRRLQGNVCYNISVYDELLDTSLDERGVDLVLNILRERAERYNECIMIISHRKESIKIGTHYKNTGGVIFLEKENGITRRVDFVE